MMCRLLRVEEVFSSTDLVFSLDVLSYLCSSRERESECVCMGVCACEREREGKWEREKCSVMFELRHHLVCCSCCSVRMPPQPLFLSALMHPFARLLVLGGKKAKEEAKEKNRMEWLWKWDWEKASFTFIKSSLAGTFDETFIFAKSTVKMKIYRGGINHLLVGN